MEGNNNLKTLQECKDEVARLESERLKDNNRIFYPDPMEENNCAQCGKQKEQHSNDVYGNPFFCQRLSTKTQYQLNDEAAELYAQQFKESQSKEIEELKAWKESAIKSAEFWDKIIEFAKGSKLFRAGDHIPTKTIEVIGRLSALNEAAEKVIESYMNDDFDMKAFNYWHSLKNKQ